MPSERMTADTTSTTARLVKKAQNSNLTKIAYGALRNDIVMNNIKAGECLSGCQLAKKLKMSRTPVREALNILASEGFVEIRNGVGIFVKKLTEKDIVEVIEVRSALECSALEARTLSIDYLKLDELYRGWVEFKNKISSGNQPDLDEIMTLDYETHDFIVLSSNNSYLVELIRNVSARVRQMQYLSVMGLNDIPDTVEQHIEILGAIKKGDIKQSTSLLKEHIQEAASYIFTLIAEREGDAGGRFIIN